MKFINLTVKLVMLLTLVKVRSNPIDIDTNEGRLQYFQAFGTEDTFVTDIRQGRSEQDGIRAKVETFQRSFGLKVTGNFDRPTMNLLRKSRCGLKDDNIIPRVLRRQKRSVVARPRWYTPVLKYRLKNGPDEISFQDTRSILQEAFQIWENAGTPLRFIESDPGDSDVHILVEFRRQDHGDFQKFDGKGRPGHPNILSHAYGPPQNEYETTSPEDGDIHIDDDDAFSTNPSDQEFDLLTVILHEIGHAIGLVHSGDLEAIMAPFLTRGVPSTGLKEEDIAQIKSLYGDGSPTTTTVATTTTSAGDRFLQCGSNEFLNPGQSLSFKSPNYGTSDYPSDTDCTYAITTAPGFILEMTSIEFNTEYNYDFLEVFDGPTITSPSIAEFSGNQINGIKAQSTRPQLTARFISDYSVGAPGFHIRVTSKLPGQQLSSTPSTTTSPPTTTTTASTTTTTTATTTTTTTATPSTTTTAAKCGEVINLSPGATKVISSPGYPNKYPEDITCEWMVSVPNNMNIGIQSTYFATERNYDFVKIYDGTSPSGNMIGQYSGSQAISEMSPNSNVFIRFNSDDVYPDNGFTIVLSAAGGPTTTTTQSTTTTDSTVTSTTQTTTSTGTTTAQDGCGGTFYLAPGANMKIISPNFPQNYPHFSDCVWTFNTASNSRIRLTSSNFFVEFGYDFTSVYDGPNVQATLLEKLTGQLAAVDKSSSQQSMTVHFQSDYTGNKQGFEMQVSAFNSGNQVPVTTTTNAPTTSTQSVDVVTTDGSCGGTHTLYSGTLEIRSPNYPDPYPLEVVCPWKIFTSFSQKIQLKSEFFETEQGYDFLVVHDGNTNTATEIGRYSGDTNLLVTSTGSSMTIEFKSDDVVPSNGFVLRLTPLSKDGPCDQVTCENGGTCQPIPGGNPPYQCQCDKGYTGLTCSEHVCTVNPCDNGGNCTEINVGRKYLCTCPTGYQQPNCTLHVCQTLFPCAHGGTCRPANNNVGYLCDCPDHRLGDNCGAHICDGRPCINGGQCIEEFDGYRCNCNNGYGGANCTQHVCSSNNNPCQNGGSCLQTLNNDGYSCVCPSGFTGKHCETRNANSCSPNPCQNSATCLPISRAPNYLCICQPGYSGLLCQDSACEKNPCSNGGTCVPTSSSPFFRCTCRSGSSGTLCQDSPATTEAPSVDISVLNELVGADDVDMGYDKDGSLALWAFKGNQVYKYSKGLDQSYNRAYPQDIVDYENFWPVFGPIRAVVFLPKQERVEISCTSDLCPREATALSNETLRKDTTAIFMSQHFARFDFDGQFENAYGNISTSIIGLPDDLDCAFHVKGVTYYVKGDRYYEVWDINNRTVSRDSPKQISNSPFSAMGSRIHIGFFLNEKLHLFNDILYYRYSDDLKLDPGFPITLARPQVTPSPPMDGALVDALSVGPDGYLKAYRDDYVHIFKDGQVEVKPTSLEFDFVNEKIDAALESGNMARLFKGIHVMKYQNRVTFPPYPKIQEEYTGVPATYRKVDSAFKVNDVTYLTSGTTLIEYRGRNNVVTRPISQTSFSAMDNGADAAVYKEGKAYLVKGTKLYRYTPEGTPEGFRLDSGFPRDISQGPGVIGRSASFSDTMVMMMNYMLGRSTSQGGSGDNPTSTTTQEPSTTTQQPSTDSPGTSKITYPSTTRRSLIPVTTYINRFVTTRPPNFPEVARSLNICDGGTVTAAYSKGDYVYAFVDTFIYKLGRNPNSNNFKVSEYQFINVTYPIIDGPVDAVLHWPAQGQNEDTLFLFKGPDVYRKVGNFPLQPFRIASLFGGIQGTIDAAYVWNGLSYLVQGNTYYLAQRHAYFTLNVPLTMRVFNMPDGATAAFSYNGETHFFKGDQYYRMLAGTKEISSDSPKSVKKHWFNCAS